jgi:Astacin (Peptidase family M12A)
VTSRDEAEIRVGFMQGDGSWSYLGRQILDRGANERTMNFGWDLLRTAREADTALHEIGHTLGLPHEHQNPNAGIVWDEEKVYTSLGGPPNNWPRETTQWNILRKIEPDTVQGSNWDPDSIMHYPFPAGLILQQRDFVIRRPPPASTRCRPSGPRTP